MRICQLSILKYNQIQQAEISKKKQIDGTLCVFIMDDHLHHNSSFRCLYVIIIFHLVFYRMNNSQKSIQWVIFHLVSVWMAIYSFQVSQRFLIMTGWALCKVMPKPSHTLLVLKKQGSLELSTLADKVHIFHPPDFRSTSL